MRSLCEFRKHICVVLSLHFTSSNMQPVDVHFTMFGVGNVNIQSIRDVPHYRVYLAWVLNVYSWG